MRLGTKYLAFWQLQYSNTNNTFFLVYDWTTYYFIILAKCILKKFVFIKVSINNIVTDVFCSYTTWLFITIKIYRKSVILIYNYFIYLCQVLIYDTLEIPNTIWYHECIYQGQIQNFKLGGGVHLKKLRRAEGGGKIFGVFRVKNHDFTPKNLIFSNFRGGARQVRPPA